jgi:hypothetical protein
MRRAARRDQNEAALVAFFQAHGCEVERINQGGLPDLIVGRLRWDVRKDDRVALVQCPDAKFALVEVKTRRGQLRVKQETFRRKFPVWVVRSDEDAEKVIKWLTTA